jgi:hypothetical protein
MTIVNGKWSAEDGSPVDEFNYDELKEIKEKVSSVYGKDISHDRITIISKIQHLNERQEQVLARLLSDDELFSKLIGI